MGKSIKATYTEGSVTTNSSVVLAAKGDRQFLFIQNTGAQDVYIEFGATATADANSYILLASTNDTIYQVTRVESQSVNAITASGTSTLKIGEA